MRIAAPWVRAIGLGVLMLVAAEPVRAQQQAADFVAAGLRAYRELDYDRAAQLFRLGLVGSGPTALSDSARGSTWVLLGAAHLFRGRGDSATSAFRSALAADVRIRPDTLIFPPAVGTAFERVRLTTAFVGIVVPADTVVPLDGAYVVHLYASAPHRVEVTVVDDQGNGRRLFAGAIGESLRLRWPARDSSGTSPPPGSKTLEVTSRPESTAPRSIRLALELSSVTSDTSPLPTRPPDPTPPRPVMVERTHLRFGALAVGLASGAAAVLLPTLLKIDGGGNAARFGVGGALGLAGVIGFVTGRSRQPAETVVQPSPGIAMAAWRRAVDSVHAENTRRSRAAAIRIRKVGEPVPVK